MEPKNNTAYSGQPSSQPSGQLSSNSYGASPTGAKPNSPNSNKYRNWCIWGGLIIALLIVLGACCYHIVARGSAPVVVTDSVSTRLLQDSLSNNKTRIVQLTPEFIKAIEQYDELSLYSEGYAAVRKGELWGYIDTWGREVIPCKYYCAYPFHEGYAAVCKNGRRGYIDTWGREVIPCKYEEANPFHEGLASVKLSFGDGWAFIDTLGQVVISPLTDTWEMNLPGEFSDGRVVFISGDLKHFTVLDRQGNIVFRDTYDENSVQYGLFGSVPFENSALVAKYIDGKLYVPRDDSEYYRVYDTEGNRLKDASREEKKKIEAAINAVKGKAFIRTMCYDSDEWFEGALCLLGVKDSDGKVLIPAEYDHVSIYIDPDDPIDLSNGVVPVALVEYKESEGLFVSGLRGFYSPGGGKTYYGYADLKGNDTFPKGLKERCKKARQRTIKYRESDEGVYGENNLVNGRDLPDATEVPAEDAAWAY